MKIQSRSSLILLAWFLLLGITSVPQIQAQSPKPDVALRHVLEDAVSIGGLKSKSGRLTDNQIIDFAIAWNFLRHPRRFTFLSEESRLSLPGRYVTEGCRQLFNRTPHLTSIVDWNYRNSTFFGFSDQFEQLGHFEIKNVQLKKKKVLLEATVSYVDPFMDGIQRRKVIVRPVVAGNKKRYFIVVAGE